MQIDSKPVGDSRESDKLEELAKKTGLSVQTLKLIKQKEDLVKKTKSQIGIAMKGEDEKREVDTMVKLAEQIRYIMQTRGTNTLKMPVILQIIDERQQ